MKSQYVIIICFCLAVFSEANAQYIANGGFENWEERILYEEPETWNTGNQEAFMFNATTTSPTTDSYSGSFAIRLETVTAEEDTLFGYAFCNGMVTDGDIGDTLHFTGGIPISVIPDSLFGYFKYEMAENDTGLVVVSFKREGDIISQNLYSIWGIQNSYTKMIFDIESIAETPDTVMIAFACSNPNNPIPGSWMQVDSLWFGNIADSIPNTDFEVWEDASYYEPEHWLTGNLFAYLFGGDTCARPSPDAHSGSYSLRIESIETLFPSDEGLTTIVVGFAMPYSTSLIFGESMPTFDVDFNPAALTGYYKFEPLANDTALIYINLIDDEENSYPAGWLLLPTAEYTAFEVPLVYPSDVTITEVSIVLSTTIYFMQGDGQSGEIGSVLYLDDLDLFNPCDTFPTYSIASVIPADCSDFTAFIDAGDGWDEYLWSTQETTQTISVTVTATTTYSVTVTNAATGCQFSDEIELFPPDGCGTAVELTEYRTPGIELYPNPASGLLTLEFQNLESGMYTTELVDITGKVILSERITINENKKKVILDLTRYTEGLYLIKIQGEKFNYCERLMIK